MVAAQAHCDAPIAVAHQGRKRHAALLALQGLLALFFLVAAALPKLLGEATAVAIFADLGGQWFRYLVGGLELACAIGLLVPRFARPAALGLAAVMVGATVAQLFVLNGGPLALTPAILLVLLLAIAWGRGGRTAG